MADRTSTSSLRATLTLRGRALSGWTTVTFPDHDLPTGSYTPAGGGSVATVGTGRQGGQYVLTKKFSATEWAFLNGSGSPDASAVFHAVDADERILSTVRRTTGVVTGATTSGLDTASGDPLMMMVRYTADGAIG